MRDFRDRFEEQLLAAGKSFGAQGEPSRRAGRLRRRRNHAVAIAVGTAVLGGSALAATWHPWSPTLGNPSLPDSTPTVSGQAPPRQQLAVLGVLRRPAAQSDRDAATSATLRYMSARTRGVHTDYIRRLGTTSDGQAITLVPAQAWSSSPDQPVVRDALCIIASDTGGTGAAKACFTTSDVDRGHAFFELGAHLFGLVPDKVTSVSASFRDALDVSADVHDNFFDVTEPSNPLDLGPTGSPPIRLTWRGANGDTLLTITP